MRYELTEHEWTAIRPMLPNKPRGVTRVNDSTKHDFNSFPVVEEGKMLGIVTKFDFLRTFAFTTAQMVPHYDELMRRPVGEMMTEAVGRVEPATPLTRVLPS